jgi:hypothetical protein
VAGMIQIIVRDVWDTRRGEMKREPTVGEDKKPAGVAEDEKRAGPPAASRPAATAPAPAEPVSAAESGR